MNIKVGDILQKGLHFYRVYSVGHDIVMNRILYNPKKNILQIYHGYDIAEWSEINTVYIVFDSENPDTKSKLEFIKRKYKLLKLNEIYN